MFEFWLSRTFTIVARYFILAGSFFFIFYILFKNKMWFRKIQKRMPTLSDYGRDVLYSLISVVIFASIAVFIFVVYKEHTNMYDDISEYGWGYYAFTFVWMFFLHDTYFYWIHRLMHHPRLFKTIHLIHHKSTNPSPWTAYAFHPVEAVLEEGIVVLIAFTLPVHTTAVGLFFLFQIVYNVYAHLGYELYPKKFHKHWLGKWINTSVAHNLHHKGFDGNYGIYTLIWDRWMGTLREDYDKTYVETTEGVSDNASSLK